MPYTPKRQLKEKTGINWWLVVFLAILTFAGSVLFGRWLGGELISSRAAVSPPPANEQIYTVPTPDEENTPVVPDESGVPRQNVTQNPLQVPPPVVETPPPDEDNGGEQESPAPAESASPAPKPSPSPSTNSTTSSKGKTPSVAASPGPATGSAAGPFEVQVGAFTEEQNATDLQKDLSDEGYASVVVKLTVNAAPYYQVCVGPYKDPAAAKAASDELNDLGYQTFVLNEASGGSHATSAPQKGAAPPPAPAASQPPQ